MSFKVGVKNPEGWEFSRVFETREQASKYMRGVAVNRLPFIAKIRADGTICPETSFESAVCLLAHHTGLIMSSPPGEFRCGLIYDVLDPVYTVTIERGRLSDSDPVWDQVWISLPRDEDKGNWCGNRCGGRETLAGLYAPVLGKIYESERACEEYNKTVEVR